MSDLRFLLIDDNPDDRALVLRSLNKEFPKVAASQIADSEGLAQALTRTDYDLVITDYQLNWATGLELLPILKRRLPECPVIMFTATGSEEIAVDAMKNGLDDYVLKSPRHFVRLNAAVRNQLEAYRTRRRAEHLDTRMRTLLTRLNVGVYRATCKGHLLDANPAFWRIFGFKTWQEAQGWELHRALARPKDRVRIAQELARAGQVRIPELPLQGPEGGTQWVSLTLCLQSEGEDGVVDGMVEDVTERRNLNETLRLREEELRQAQKLESISRLAGGVAHDFNNLLTAINGYSELLLGMIGEEHHMRESLVEIKRAGTRATTLTRQLLAFSRRQMLQPRVLTLNAIIKAMLETIRRTAGDGIDLRFELEADLGTVKADASQVEQVILNLVLNARDAMPGGGRLTIATANLEVGPEGPCEPDYEAKTELEEKAKPGPYVVLIVSDTGAGMDAGTRARVFEPFFTTKPMGKGTGLGLSTAYGIVKQSSGHIFVHSSVGRGTRFRIYLPRIFEETGVLATPASRTSGPGEFE